jgi:hypothetical protein
MIRIEQSVCQNFDQARKLEWLDTNGLHWFKEVTNPFLYYVVKAR